MKIDFFKKTFFIINKPYNERFIDAYNKNPFSGFCTKESHGYIYFIKNKYQLIYPPKIINLSQNRVKLPYWIFGKNKREIQNNKIILLNYNSNKNFNLDNFLIKNNYNNQCFFLVNK
jgi:hypothetical protein